MERTVPLDEWISDTWYPGFVKNDGVVRAYDNDVLFSPSDASGFWVLDFHQPSGLTPLQFTVNDEVAWGSQVAADWCSVPSSRGLRRRFVGIHMYASEVPVTSAREIELRGARAAQVIPRFIEEFPQTWESRKDEIERWLGALEPVDLTGLDEAELATYFEDSWTFLRRAWEIHFELMYPLVANFVGFSGLCEELGVDAELVPRLLQGFSTKTMEIDAALWRLADVAAGDGLIPLFQDTPAEEINEALRDAGPEAEHFLAALDAFLAEYGWRTEGQDPTQLPWAEDPTIPLTAIAGFLAGDDEHDFDAAQRAAEAGRLEAIEAARAQLTVEEREAFAAGLAGCHHANFNWWNEEHNFWIDFRAHVPFGRAAREILRRAGAGDPLLDSAFLFGPEVRRLSRGELEWSDLAPLIEARREYFDRWTDRRDELPRLLGTIPEQTNDPVVKEIYGVGPVFFAGLEAGEDAVEVLGLPAAPGRARGRARVIIDARNLGELEPGEILVCEATSPNWTPAFGTIAACVCDAGGSLTHASIVSREYGVPCVTGCASATRTIATGDELEVDGSSGRVTILARAQVVVE